MSRERVLVIAAHMDDEVLGVGATIARHVRSGDRVTVCIACHRAYDHQIDPLLVRQEQASAKQAARALGYQDLRFLGLHDERLDERLIDVIVPLEACVRKVRPTIVYTHHRGDSNQDHRAVYQATLIACRSLSKPKTRRLLAYEVPSSTDIAAPVPEAAFQPNFYVNVEASLPRKLAAMRCYRRELRPFPHPRSLKGLQILAAKRGMEIGFDAAEAFMLLRDEWA